jgi:hypothetical protein
VTPAAARPGEQPEPGGTSYRWLTTARAVPRVRTVLVLDGTSYPDAAGERSRRRHGDGPLGAGPRPCEPLGPGVRFADAGPTAGSRPVLPGGPPGAMGISGWGRRRPPPCPRPVSGHISHERTFATRAAPVRRARSTRLARHHDPARDQPRTYRTAVRVAQRVGGWVTERVFGMEIGASARSGRVSAVAGAGAARPVARGRLRRFGCIP